MSRRLILVRHAAVHAKYAGLCYGQSDVELSEAGWERSRELAELLASEPVQRIVHSGLQRTQWLAEAIASRMSLKAEACEQLRERDFGTWELKSWDAIHRESGEDMLRMLTDPAGFRPGGGETTYELRDRVLRWLADDSIDGVTIAVTHGGPIAALRGSLQNIPVTEWPRLIPACGESMALEISNLKSQISNLKSEI
jgi:broad specificity phosphatase PhoE